MPKTVKTAKPETPGSVLQSFLDEYQITAFSLSKHIKLSNAQILNIIHGKAKISVPTALKLALFFDNDPKFWLDLQIASEILALSGDKQFISEAKTITKAVKPKGNAKPEVKTKQAVKAGKRKPATIAEKRKTAAKVSDVITPKGKRGRPATKK